MSLANLYWLTLRGLRNSSYNISPGCTGSIVLAVIGFLLMVINYFNLKGVSLVPAKAYSPLIVNPDAVLTLPVAYEFL